MKRGTWLVVVLVLVGAGLLILFQRKPADIVPASPDAELAPVAKAETRLKPLVSKRSNDAQPQSVAEALNHLQVIVQSEDGRALEGAEVRTSNRGERGSPSLTNYNATFTTTAHGIASVSWPTQKLDQFEITASKDNYASLKMVWDLKTGDVIPPVFTIKLKAGFQVGGSVVDPDDKPVPDATVSLFRYWSGGDERQRKGEEAAFSRQKHTTDGDGRWRAQNLPAELLHRIFVEASHTNFIGTQISMDGKPQVEKELRAGTYKLALKRGLELRGHVVDEQQQPVAGAQVAAGRKYSRDRQETKSDEQGRFSFRNINEGSVLFSVMATGFAPDSKSHAVSATAGEIVFQLTKGSVVRGIVQNEAGEPVDGVRVSLAGTPGDPAYDHYSFSTVTGSDGRFEWNSAPNEPMPFYFGRTGYEQRRGVRLKPGDENVVTLKKSRQVKGQVQDAETGQPVTQFKIAIGRDQGTGRFFNAESSQSGKEFKSDEGLFTIEANEETSNAIKAEADGYAEQVLPLPKAQDGEVQVLFKMKPSKALEGVVITPDGKPVSGASVGIVDGGTGGRSVQFANGRLRSTSSATKLSTTDGSGRFSIQSPPETGNVVASSTGGFASATIAEVRASGVMTLQLFGRIEGVLIRGSEIGAGQELFLSTPNGGISFDFQGYKVTTGSDGGFAFENVPPGTVSIVRLVKTASGSWMHSHRTDLVVKSGETTQVTLGGSEATIRGNVRFDGDPPTSDFILSAQLSTPSPQIPTGMTPEERSAYLNSPAWKEQISDRKSYSATVAADGSVILDSVAPGQYTLRVTATESTGDSFSRKSLAQGETTVTVPAGAGPGTPVDVGEVVLKRNAAPANTRRVP
ncbi:MAG TPA: carboxypeptidase-like regulatory domain-containing protein [Candidatus Acidoferrum sp.]|nr:carboxypeptidase-like regulatory domain-containing protein [Candidatus Acidoferrum sp.]